MFYLLVVPGVWKDDADYPEFSTSGIVPQEHAKRVAVYFNSIFSDGSKSEFWSLRAAQEIGTLGFPGEIEGGSIDRNESRIATFKAGTVSALRPYQDWIRPVATQPTWYSMISI